MQPRDPHEGHRAATPLELFFDLVSVIAIAAAAAGLHHAIAAGHALDGLVRFLPAFFAIWWAWMNYTWFASAYDNGDVVFRLLTFLVMGGSLVMAAGIGPLFASLDLKVIIAGYVIMRLAMVVLWLRAAKDDPARRGTALAYAGGIALVQLYWIALLFLAPPSLAWFLFLFAIGIVLELAVPALAERRSTTPWHRHHIIERYGLLTIIVLGESLLAAVMSLRVAFTDHYEIALVHIAMSALVIVAAMWWLYFDDGEHLRSDRLDRALTWGYGHGLVFASGAAVGAGFGVLVDVVTDHAAVGIVTGDYAVAIPVALYMAGLWFVRDRFNFTGSARFVLPVFAVLIVLGAPIALEIIATLAVLAVVVRSWLVRREASTR